MRKASRERLTDNLCGGQLFYSNNKLRLCGKSNTVGFYRCEILVYHPLCSHTLWGKGSETKEQEQHGEEVESTEMEGGGVF